MRRVAKEFIETDLLKSIESGSGYHIFTIIQILTCLYVLRLQTRNSIFGFVLNGNLHMYEMCMKEHKDAVDLRPIVVWSIVAHVSEFLLRWGLSKLGHAFNSGKKMRMYTGSRAEVYPSREAHRPAYQNNDQHSSDAVNDDSDDEEKI